MKNLLAFDTCLFRYYGSMILKKANLRLKCSKLQASTDWSIRLELMGLHFYSHHRQRLTFAVDFLEFGFCSWKPNPMCWATFDWVSYFDLRSPSVSKDCLKCQVTS